MKTLMVLSGVLASMLALGAPDPAYVPASAGLVVVIDGLNSPTEGQQQVLEALRKDSQEEAMKPEQPKAPGSTSGDLLKAFVGYSAEDHTLTAESIVYALVYPETPEAAETEILVIENAALDLPSVTAALKERIAETTEPSTKDPIAVEAHEGWTQVLYPAEAAEADFIGYHAIPGGVLFVAMRSLEEAEAYRKGRNTLKGTQSPLLEAFAPREAADGITATLVIEDLKALIHATEKEAREGIERQAPNLLKCSKVTGRYRAQGTTSLLSLTISADDEDAANEVYEQIISLKVFATQLLAALIPPDAASIQTLRTLRAQTSGTTTSATLAIPLEHLMKIIKEDFPRAMMALITVHLGGELELEEGEMEASEEVPSDGATSPEE